MKHIIIALLILCGIASAGFQPYDIFVIVWNNETGQPESGVDVAFSYNNQSFMLTTVDDGSVVFATQNFCGELPDGSLINVSCKYGTKQAQVHCGDAGFGVTFNEPSEETTVEAFAMAGFIAIAIGAGLYRLRRKRKSIIKEDIIMDKEHENCNSDETKEFKLKRDFGVRALVATGSMTGYILISGLAVYRGDVDMLENISKIFMPVITAIVVFYFNSSSIRDASKR